MITKAYCDTCEKTTRIVNSIGDLSNGIGHCQRCKDQIPSTDWYKD